MTLPSTLAKIAMTYVMASKQCHNGVLFVWKSTPIPSSVCKGKMSLSTLMASVILQTLVNL